uniref:Keratin n=1 Tax=Meleagris gallopavo TaxID=9103 RepID=A0A803Y8W9_MELGA
MSCYDLCPPKTSVAVPQPIAESCNELCARQCPDSTAFIQPPPVVVTFPGPILSSFPSKPWWGSSGAPAFGGLPWGAGGPLRRWGHSGLGRPLHLWQTLRFSCLQPLPLAPLQQEALQHLWALLNPAARLLSSSFLILRADL